jgi:hypothetical protein
MWTH